MATTHPIDVLIVGSGLAGTGMNAPCYSTAPAEAGLEVPGEAAPLPATAG